MISRFLLITLLLVTSALTAQAQSATRPGSNRVPSPLLAVLDADHDGMLSAREIAASPLTLAALDLNDDGMISSDEMRAANSGGRSGRSGISFNLVLALDANHDGIVQSMEIANAVSSLKQLDLNHDGDLTRDELRPVIVARS